MIKFKFMKIILSLLLVAFVSLANAESTNTTGVDFQCNYSQSANMPMTMDSMSAHVHVDCPQCLVISAADKFTKVIFLKITFLPSTNDTPYASFVSKVTTPPPTV